MLGHKLVQIFSTRFETWYSIRGEFSETAHYGIFDHDRVVPRVSAADFRTVEAAIALVAPDVVVNAIGITKQVATSKDVVQTLTINSILPQLIGELAAREGFRFITLGTDCVFSGSKGSYSETDVPDALDLYGRSKQFGEVVGPNCLTLRTSIIGRELKSSRSLIEWFLGQNVRPCFNCVHAHRMVIIRPARCHDHQVRFFGVEHLPVVVELTRRLGTLRRRRAAFLIRVCHR